MEAGNLKLRKERKRSSHSSTSSHIYLHKSELMGLHVKSFFQCCSSARNLRKRPSPFPFIKDGPVCPMRLQRKHFHQRFHFYFQVISLRHLPKQKKSIFQKSPTRLKDILIRVNAPKKPTYFQGLAESKHLWRQ